MKAVTRKLCGILLATALIVGVFTVAVFADLVTPEGSPLTYLILSGEANVVKCDTGVEEVVIPDSVEGYPVTVIYYGAFENCEALKSVTIPASVEEIRSGAFSNCINLTEVIFESGSNLKLIGYGAFAFNGSANDIVPEAIETLVLPASLETLNEGAFHGKPVKHFALEDGSMLKEIPDGFLSADGDDGMPGTNTERRQIFRKALEWFEYFTSPYTKTPETIAKACDSLETIDLGDGNSLERIGVGAFKNQTHLTGIDFGEDAQSEGLVIDYGAFVAAGNNGVAAYNGAEELGGIDTLVLPANLTEFGLKNNRGYKSRPFELARIENLVFSDGCLLEEVPDGFMEVSRSGSNGKPGTEPVQLGANALKTVAFGENNNITSIGAGAFKNQSHLTDIDFGTTAVDPETGEPKDLAIKSGAFIGVGNNGYFVERGIDDELGSGIETVTFPANLVSLGGGAFELSRVKNLVFSDNCKLEAIPSNFMGHEGTGGANGYPGTEGAQIGANALETVKFGKNNHLTYIYSAAFKEQSHITEIDFGTAADGVELTIWTGAFIGVGNNGYYVDQNIDDELNAGIETLTFPANLVRIETGAFERARVKNLVFEDGCLLETIPSNFFGHTHAGNNGHPGMVATGIYDSFVKDMSQLGTNSLETVKFGDNNHISLISYGAFMNQSHITEIDFGTAAEGVEVKFQSGTFTGVGNNSYLVDRGADESLCEGIATLTLPANLVEMEAGCFDYAAFSALAFEDGCQLTSFNPGAFQDIGVLETLTLGSDFTVTELNGGEFTRCPELTTLDMTDSKITDIGDAIKEDPKLTSIWFPETLQTITWPEMPVHDWTGTAGYTRDKICPFYGCGEVNELHFANTDPGEFFFGEDVLQFLNEAGIVYVPEETSDESIDDYIDILTYAGLTFAEDKWVIRRAVSVTGVELNKDSASLEEGKTLTLTATVKPEDAANTKVTWSSSDDSVATVDNNGKVTAVKAGNATITVTTADGGFTDTCKVKVTEKQAAVDDDDDDDVPAPVTVEPSEGGEVSVSPKNAEEGTTVTIKVTPDDGNEVDTVTVTTADGEEVEVKTKKEGDTYTFVMPDGAVFIDVTYKKTGEEAGLPFTDVSPSDYFYEAVKWAYFADPQVTDGTSPTTFSPFKTCNRAEVVTFLWRAVGKPEPAGAENPFTDVSESDWFYKPVLWAVEQGITEGTSETTFSPKGSCRNDHILTFIYRAVGAGEDGWFMEAYNWAVEKGLIEGTYSGEFDLTASCPRANVVEYLYRYHKGL